MTALDGRVTVNSNNINSANARITSLTARVDAQVTAFNTLNARVTTQGNLITANASNISAARAQIAGLDGTVTGLGAAITALRTTVTGQGTQINVLTTSMTTVTARANAATANGLLSWSATAGPGGTGVRIGLSAKVTVNGTARTAGMFIDVSPTRADVLFNAQRFIVIDGDHRGIPFVYEGSVLKTFALQVGTATFNTLKSANGKWVQRGYGQFADLTLYD